MLVGTHVLLLLVPGGELKDGGEAHVLLLLVPDVELDGSAIGGESMTPCTGPPCSWWRARRC